MASYFSKDFLSELTPGKITAKILVGLFIAFLAFCYDRISEFILNIYKTISQTLYDNLLQSVAEGPKDYSLAHIDIFLYLLILLMIYITFSLRLRVSKAISEAEANIELIKAKELPKKGRNIKKLKTFLNAQIIFLVLVLLLEIFAFSLERSKSEIRRAFERKVKIISPYVDTKHKDKLISDFSLMKEERDYIKINASFDSLFKANNLRP